MRDRPAREPNPPWTDTTTRPRRAEKRRRRPCSRARSL